MCGSKSSQFSNPLASGSGLVELSHEAWNLSRAGPATECEQERSVSVGARFQKVNTERSMMKLVGGKPP